MTVPEKLEFEIDHYVKSPIADLECDPLEWWNSKVNNIPYPFLAKIARNICQSVLQAVFQNGSLALQVKLYLLLETT